MYEKILANIKYSETEKTRINLFLKRMIDKAKDWVEDEKVEVMLCGSMAKGTALRNNSDIDVFLLFPKDTREERLKEWGLYFGHAITKDLGGISTEKYASHPYVSARIDSFNVDFVPCYKIKDASELKSAVDRTPLHTEYVNKHLKEHQKEDVLLLKQFMKSIDVYGSDTKVNGFSGYLCEVLVMHYGSFINVLKASMQWHEGFIIDLENTILDNPMDPNQTLLVPDPIDSTRNVAAALSKRKMHEFQYGALAFLKSNERELFFSPKSTLNVYKIEDNFDLIKDHIINVTFPAPKIPKDALHSQLQSLVNGLTKFYAQYGYNVLAAEYNVYNHHCKIAFFFESIEQSPLIKQMGPKFDSPGKTGFIEHHGWKNVMIDENGYLYTYVVNKGFTASVLTRKILTNDYNEFSGGKDVKRALIDYGHMTKPYVYDPHIKRILVSNHQLYR